MGGVWPTDALVCADSQVGPFRRTSAPHDLEQTQHLASLPSDGLLAGTGKAQLLTCFRTEQLYHNERYFASQWAKAAEAARFIPGVKTQHLASLLGFRA